jgi:hypothetical protein
MPHLAAIILGAKAPLEVQEVQTPRPGPGELLIKNELVGLQPIDAKFAKAAMFPLHIRSSLAHLSGVPLRPLAMTSPASVLVTKSQQKRLLWPWATSRAPSSNVL